MSCNDCQNHGKQDCCDKKPNKIKHYAKKLRKRRIYRNKVPIFDVALSALVAYIIADNLGYDPLIFSLASVPATILVEAFLFSN